MKKTRILCIAFIVIILLIIIYKNALIGYEWYINKKEKNVFVALFNYYTGVYSTQDLNYTNVLDFSKKENNEIFGSIYIFDEKNRLIEEKKVYYYILKEDAEKAFNNFKEASEKSVSGITNVEINDTVVSIDINGDKSKNINEMFDNLDSKITENSVFLVLK